MSNTQIDNRSIFIDLYITEHNTVLGKDTDTSNKTTRQVLSLFFFFYINIHNILLQNKNILYSSIIVLRTELKSST